MSRRNLLTILDTEHSVRAVFSFTIQNYCTKMQIKFIPLQATDRHFFIALKIAFNFAFTVEH